MMDMTMPITSDDAPYIVYGVTPAELRELPDVITSMRERIKVDSGATAGLNDVQTLLEGTFLPFSATASVEIQPVTRPTVVQMLFAARTYYRQAVQDQNGLTACEADALKTAQLFLLQLLAAIEERHPDSATQPAPTPEPDGITLEGITADHIADLPDKLIDMVQRIDQHQLAAPSLMLFAAMLMDAAGKTGDRDDPIQLEPQPFDDAIIITTAIEEHLEHAQAHRHGLTPDDIPHLTAALQLARTYTTALTRP